MPKFKFKVTTKNNPAGFWENHNENSVVDQESADKLARGWVKSYNATEVLRYGEKAETREIVCVEFVGDGDRQHEFEKRNLYTVAGDGHAPRDKWVCKHCGCEGLRYGLSSTIKRTGKWTAKKYEFCKGKEDND